MTGWRRGKHLAAVGLGFALSAFFLWLSLRDVDTKGLREAFASINYVSVLLCAVAVATGVLLRAERWRVIAGHPAAERGSFIRATSLGVMSNLVIPGRAGEFIRVVVLAKFIRSSLAGPLASALIDRLADLFVLLASAATLYAVSPIEEILDQWLISLFVVASGILLMVFVYAKSSGGGAAMAAGIAGRWLRRWPIQPQVFMAELHAEFRRLVGGWQNIKLTFLMILVLGADYCVVSTLLWGFDLSLPIEAPLLLWVFLAAGSALPSAPGYVGIYQVAAIWALSLYSVTASIAFALASVLQLIVIVVAFTMAGLAAREAIRSQFLRHSNR
ncbi:MAG: hypothetical protein POELPBGB_04232 [Bacteroidia bacterium]|nr:hypothetical protein [Bacteroidia bacterium]